MKHLIVLVLCITTFYSFCQTDHIQTEIKSQNIFDLSIVGVFPDSFPHISVVFQAKNEFGEPLWHLDKSELNVTENNQECEKIRLINISKDKPINIGLVFDHSGSMVDNPTQMPKDAETMQTNYFYNLPMPKNYVMAIDYAKEGVISFLNETETSKDSVLFVGFSSTVDKIYPLTNNLSKIKSFVKKVTPSGSTAFYDALHLTIEKLSKSASKSVIVALTDGLDNMSRHNSAEIIDLANEKEIVIYTIGLGNANAEVLQEVSKQTDGFYYYTNDPQKLKDIYLNIKKQIKSIYQMDYISNNQNHRDETRNIRFSFVNDTLKFSNDSTIFSLPEEVISYLKIKEEERLIAERNQLIAGSSFGILLLGIGSFLIYRRKKRPLKINKAYPNPFNDNLTITYNGSNNSENITLKIIDTNGKIVFEQSQISHTGEQNFNLAFLNSGIYLAQIYSNKNISKTMKIIKQ